MLYKIEKQQGHTVLGITRRHFLAAVAASLGGTARGAGGFDDFLTRLNGDFDNIVFTEPHIGGMFFSAPAFLGQDRGPLTALPGKRLLALELTSSSPQMYGHIDLQGVLGRIAHNRQLVGKLLFGQAHIRPTFLGVDDPTLAGIAAPRRMELFANGVLDAIERGHAHGLTPCLIDFFRPELADFIARNSAALARGDLAATRDYARIRLDDSVQADKLRTQAGGTLKGIVSLVGWEHTAGQLDVPGLDQLLDGRTATVALFHDRANEDETLRMTAHLGRPGRNPSFTIYLASGEVIGADRTTTIATFPAFNLLRARPEPGVAAAPG